MEAAARKKVAKNPKAKNAPPPPGWQWDEEASIPTLEKQEDPCLPPPTVFASTRERALNVDITTLTHRRYLHQLLRAKVRCLRVCVCVCVCTHTYIHTYIDTYHEMNKYNI